MQFAVQLAPEHDRFSQLEAPLQFTVAEVPAETLSDWHELVPWQSMTQVSQEIDVPVQPDVPHVIVHTPAWQTPPALTHPGPHGLTHWPIAAPLEVHDSVAGHPLPPVARQPGAQSPVVVSHTCPLSALPQLESSVHADTHVQVA